MDNSTTEVLNFIFDKKIGNLWGRP